MNFLNTLYIDYYIYVYSINLNGSFIKPSICKRNEKWAFVLLVQQKRVEPKKPRKPKRAKKPKKLKKPKNIKSLSNIEYQVFECFVRSSI